MPFVSAVVAVALAGSFALWASPPSAQTVRVAGITPSPGVEAPVDELPGAAEVAAGDSAELDSVMEPVTRELLERTEREAAAGAEVINPDRMWHYTEGIRNWDPIWANHGIRILPGPSSLWLSATGERFPAPYLPGFDSLGTLGAIMRTGYDYSWFVLTQKVIEKEFALSGSEQNPDITGRSVRELLKTRVASGAPAPVEAFKRHGADFVVERDLRRLVERMNGLTDTPLLSFEQVEREVVARDRELDNPFTKDLQVTAIHGARRYLADRHPGGGMAGMDEDDFADMVEQSPVKTFMVEYREPSAGGKPGKLVGACLTDQQGDGLSMIYSFYDVGSDARPGLGTAIILDHITRAAKAGLPYVYLGYWVEGSDRMAYKAKFKPLERLTRDGWQAFDPVAKAQPERRAMPRVFA